MVERFRRYWADMIGRMEKLSSAQTFTDNLNLPCDLELERSNPIFPQATPAYDAVLSDQVWLQTDQQFRSYNRNSHILIMLTLLHKHTSLVTKCSLVQKMLSRQTFTNILNLHCGLDLECNNPIFPQDTPAYDGVLSNQVWLQTDQHFGRDSKNSHILII